MLPAAIKCPAVPTMRPLAIERRNCHLTLKLARQSSTLPTRQTPHLGRNDLLLSSQRNNRNHYAESPANDTGRKRLYMLFIGD